MPGDENWIVWSRQLVNKLQQYKSLNHRLAVDNGYLLAQNNQLKAKVSYCASCQTKLGTTPPPEDPPITRPTRRIRLPSPPPPPPAGFKPLPASSCHKAPVDGIKHAHMSDLSGQSNNKNHILSPITESTSPKHIPAPLSNKSTTSHHIPCPFINESTSTIKPIAPSSVSVIKHIAPYSPSSECATSNHDTNKSATKHTTHPYVSESASIPTTEHTARPSNSESTPSTIKHTMVPPNSESTFSIKHTLYKRAIATVDESETDMGLVIPTPRLTSTNDSSDTSSSLLPAKRARHQVSYVLPSLRKKLRRGDQFACNSHSSTDTNDLSSSWPSLPDQHTQDKGFQVIASSSSNTDSPLVSEKSQPRRRQTTTKRDGINIIKSVTLKETTTTNFESGKRK